MVIRSDADVDSVQIRALAGLGSRQTGLRQHAEADRPSDQPTCRHPLDAIIIKSTRRAALCQVPIIAIRPPGLRTRFAPQKKSSAATDDEAHRASQCLRYCHRQTATLRRPPTSTQGAGKISSEIRSDPTFDENARFRPQYRVSVRHAPEHRRYTGDNRRISPLEQAFVPDIPVVFERSVRHELQRL